MSILTNFQYLFMSGLGDKIKSGAGFLAIPQPQ